MNEPRRLLQSGGASQRLLDSASIDKPSEAARRRAEMFAGTAGAFTSTAAPSGVRAKRGGTVKTIVIWASIGAAASAALAFGVSQLMDPSDPRAAAAPSGSAMAELPLAPAPRPTDITPESSSPAKPLGSIVPWVPSPSSAPPAEARDIEAARLAVSRGDNAGALATLDRYDASHPSGALKAESTVLRVQALSNSGKTSEAKRLANEFAAKNPAHPLTESLKRVGE